jgi:hypothetical protein
MLNEMKQCLFILIAVFAFVSCINNSAVVKKSKFENFIAQYKEISIDTFRVYSTSDTYSDTFKFKGTLIDTSFIKQFPKRLLFNFPQDKEYYACFKFSIDSNRIGLITRTPGDYTSSSIELLVFDKGQDSIVDCFELADTWYDAEDDSIKVSWIFKDADQSVKTYLWEHNSSIADEPNAKKITITHYYLVDLSKNKHDTVQTDNASMLNKFISK